MIDYIAWFLLLLCLPLSILTFAVACLGFGDVDKLDELERLEEADEIARRATNVLYGSLLSLLIATIAGIYLLTVANV